MQSSPKLPAEPATILTPPVALAAYAAASIAGASIMSSALAAFRFALVGFTLPFLFVLRPQLLMIDPDGGPASWSEVSGAVILALAGILPFAVGIAGYLFSPLSWGCGPCRCSRQCFCYRDRRWAGARPDGWRVAWGLPPSGYWRLPAGWRASARPERPCYSRWRFPATSPGPRSYS